MIRNKTQVPSLFEAFMKYSEKPALINAEDVFSYKQYYQKIIKTRDTLRALGLKKGDRLAILAPNHPEYAILLMAMWSSGLIAVPISARWPSSQIDANLERVGCRRIVLSQQMVNSIDPSKFRVFLLEDLVKPGQTFMPLCAATKDENTGLFSEQTPMPLQGTTNDENRVLFSEQTPIPLQGATKDENKVLFSEQNDTTDIEVEPTEIEPGQHATILFTSGSSGDQKAVIHTLENHIYNALGANQNIPFQPDDRWLLCLPLYHIGGIAILLRALLSGGCVVIPDTGTPIEKSIANATITHLSLVATQIYRLLQNKPALESLRRMKAVLLGGGVIPEKLIKKAIEYGLPIHTSYGSTEMASQITATCQGDSGNRLFTSGKLLPYRQLRIAPDGEILVKGPTLFDGYVKGSDITKDLDKDGWFHTGDLGYLDDNGYLIVTGRKDSMFISGGENIQPEEIERIILQLPDVEVALVTPIDNEEFGQRPVAFVKLSNRRPPDTNRLKNHLQKHIARFKIPDHFFPWPDIENNQEMKPNRQFFKGLAKNYIKKTMG